MNITIDPLSADITGSHFKQKSEKLKKAVDTILKKSIFVIEKNAKYYSPVDTGRMRASIGVSGYNIDGKYSTGEQSVVFGSNFASIKPTVTYAKYVHAHVPFMTSAAQDSLNEIQKITKDEVKKALD